MKRKIDSLLKVNGHKLRPIEGTDTGWVRCTECARTAGGSSDGYWSRVSCNKKQCASRECWSRKGYMRLAKKRVERNEQMENMAAIKDKETGEGRQLTKDGKERIISNREEARRRRLRKLSISESKGKVEEIKKTQKGGGKRERHRRGAI